MKLAQLVIFGSAGPVADQLAELARSRSAWLRMVRHADACLRLLRKGGAALLVLFLSSDLERELGLFCMVTEYFPSTPVIVVGDRDHARLAGLCWDLGAAYVLFPPQPLEQIVDIAGGFLPAI